MLKINKRVEYALMALKFIATRTDEDLTSAREICEKFKTPFDTTAKVMQKMNNAGILNSVKGIKGGYTLSRPLREITYMDLVSLIEGKNVGRVCETEKGLCENYNLCNIIHPVEQLNRILTDFLKELTLEELLLGTNPLAPTLLVEAAKKEVEA
ncbi:MAG: Rrf2 family transcriptional regulator [Deltaproteobacteria bacterium]|nr:MAG: Rrf2 family transcriptional regulator [Deltaproteobacteria bacterium]TNF26785.1 MAG: Rrf2 family transcriptional regulator [Deltaproteobacteria bacterium]